MLTACVAASVGTAKSKAATRVPACGAVRVRGAPCPQCDVRVAEFKLHVFPHAWQGPSIT